MEGDDDYDDHEYAQPVATSTHSRRNAAVTLDCVTIEMESPNVPDDESEEEIGAYEEKTQANLATMK